MPSYRPVGLELGKDIQIVYTGLRPGEKLYEELLNNKENTVPTKNDQIMVAQVKQYNFDEVSAKIENLISLFNTSSIILSLCQKLSEYDMVGNNPSCVDWNVS